ncbi:hypothetical protein ACQEU3_43105 [Spirillospora sp. CA-253888]
MAVVANTVDFNRAALRLAATTWHLTGVGTALSLCGVLLVLVQVAGLSL